MRGTYKQPAKRSVPFPLTLSPSCVSHKHISHWPGQSWVCFESDGSSNTTVLNLTNMIYTKMRPSQEESDPSYDNTKTVHADYDDLAVKHFLWWDHPLLIVSVQTFAWKTLQLGGLSFLQTHTFISWPVSTTMRLPFVLSNRYEVVYKLNFY